MEFTYPKSDKIPPKNIKLQTHVFLLVPMDELWAQCTWKSLTSLTEKMGRSG